MNKKGKGIKIFLIMIMVLLALDIGFGAKLLVSANSQNNESENVLISLSNSIFGNKKIKTIEYLYNFNDSPDFVYVDYEDYGYAVFTKKNYVLIEYSATGSITYQNQEEKKYYGGPTHYYHKKEGQFVSTVSGDSFSLSENEIEEYANNIMTLFSIQGENNSDEMDLTQFKNSFVLSTGTNIPTYEDEGNIEPDPPGSEGTTYIANADYFLKNPRHGYNSTGTCGAVAAQLLLSYNNYYNDRRIITDEYLNGVWDGENNIFALENNPEQNPNQCLNPLSMTRDTLGSNGYNETDKGSYFNLLVNEIPANATTNQVKTGIQAILQDRGNIDFSLNAEYGILGGSVNGDGIKQEIDSGNPLIILMQESLGGINHYVVAYGYQNLISPTNNTEYSGYITHFGHSGNIEHKTNVWVNSAWCYSYLTLNINHTHNYNVVVDENIDGFYKEIRCGECGHRTLAEIETTDIGENEIRIEGVDYSIIEGLTIPSTINGRTVTGIGASAFANQTQITELIIPSTVLNIGEGAFENCTNLTTISGLSNVQTIGAKAFKGCSALTSITLPNTLTEIGEQAFSNCNNLNITVSTSNPNYSSENNILYNKNKTQLIQACNIASNIVIIDSVAEILPYAFEGSGNLIEVRFNTTPTIGDYAFANCTNLHTIHFDTYATPIVGTNVFLNDEFVLYVPYTSQEAYKTAFAQYVENIASVEVQVFFVSDGETIDTKMVYDGSIIADLLEPTKTGHDFGGWYSNPDFTGSVYQNGEIWETEVGLTAYAKWTAKQYSVTLNAKGGNITGENAINVTYGEAFSITSTATREGYTLDGWFDSEGTEYITAEGECTRAWDKDEDTTLYARWTIKSYEIQINNDGSITWLGKDGLSNDQCSIEYGTVLGSINLVPAYKQSAQGFKAGKIFDHFEYNDTTINWTSVPDLGENGAIITIIPIWILEEHTIYFNALCDIAVTEIVADYNTNIELPNIERTGYIFDGWYDSASGGTPISWVKMPDLTPNAQNNGSIMLYGSWSANNYSVSYNANNGTGMMSPTEFVYDVAQDLRANTFTRTGYDFMGWATTANGTVEYSDGQNVINLTSEQAGQITLYAVWEAKTYSIIAKNLMPSMYIFPNKYTYGEGLSEMPTLYVSGDYYSEEVDEFYGWYTTDTFTVKVESISNTSTGDITVYANYDYWISSTYASYEDTVTDGNISEQPSFSVDLLLGSYYYDILQNTTLNKIKITFSLSLWETNDGYQDFYLYNGDEVIWEKTIAHGGSEKDTTPRTYGAEDGLEIVLDIEDFKTVDFMDLKLGAHGWFGDIWNFENFEMSIYFTN